MEREVNMARANNSPTNLGKPDLTPTEMGDLLELFDEFRRLPPEQLNLEPRTVDRIIKSSITIQMPEESIRLRKARNEQEAFLKDILE